MQRMLDGFSRKRIEFAQCRSRLAGRPSEATILAETDQFPQQRLRFGAFEVDLRAGELWKSGRRRKLTGQPFSVLAILLERPGEVVSREELQKRLWPDTFVDVDHNLNTAINKIREALNDSSERPQFIETLSRRGYRFIAPVESVRSPAPPIPNGAAPVSPGESEAENDRTATTTTAPSAPAMVAESARVQASHAQMSGKARLGMWTAIAVAALLVLYLLRPVVPPPRVTGIRQLTHDGSTKLVYGTTTTTPPAMFTDGTRVYFAEADSAQLRVMQVSTMGGESGRVPVPFDFAGVTDLSVSQSKLLLETPSNASAFMGVLWTMPLPAGQPQSNGNLAVFDAAWSPDENWLYYTIGSDLWVARNDESQPRKLLSRKGILSWIRFSHDGQRVRFSAFDAAQTASSLWEAGTDGSHLRPVLPGWNACCGSWTRDGKYFVFASMRGGSWNLWAMREKREWWRRTDAEPVRLTVGEMSSFSPLPSSDGKTIFFVGSTPRGELVRYDLQKRLFVPYLPGLSAQGLAYSRDGSRVAWTTVPEGTLWQSKADGSDRHELTFAPRESFEPRWSPDGTRIAFAAQEPGKPSKIYIVPAEGGVAEQVTAGESSDGDPSWSPGGDALAFGGHDPNQSDVEHHPIQIVDLKNRALTALPDSSRYFSPRWSPDGRWLVALEDETFALELYNFTTRKWEELTNLPASYPNWSSDSRCVLFNSSGDPSPAKQPFYRLCLSDRRPQLLVNLAEGGQLVSGTFNFWTGVTPDGSILGIRDISIEEVYALDVDLH
jgi:Tol biopolymer transport system component/DNA-binding winged helix-turn-helix (wHTH) protein